MGVSGPEWPDFRVGGPDLRRRKQEANPNGKIGIAEATALFDGD